MAYQADICALTFLRVESRSFCLVNIEQNDQDAFCVVETQFEMQARASHVYQPT